MKTIVAVWSEFIGLFVDDWVLALSVLLWQGFVLLGVRGLRCPAGLSAPLFFAGLAAILIESARRRSRTGQRR